MAASVKVANGMATTNRLDALRLRLVAGETAQQIGARIRVRRKELGLNQRQLADLIPEPSVGNQRISDWERGVHQPTPRYLRLLATALKVEIAYFYGANGESTTSPPLLNMLEGGEEQAGEIMEMLRQLLEQQEDLAQAVASLTQAVTALRPQARPTRRRAS